MSPTPRVSIVMPTYNRKDTIKRAIDSVLQQRFADWELVIVDDGSTDGTKDLVAGIDPRVRLIVQENRGVAGARNRALAAARGSLIAFLDSDDAPSDLAGWAVVRVDGNVLLRSERAGTIRRIQEHVEGNFVLVLDDLELMCSLTSANPDVEMLAMVRSIAGDPSQPVIAVLESRHQASLEMHDSSLAPLLQMIHVDELGADDVREIVAAEASALSSIHV